VDETVEVVADDFALAVLAPEVLMTALIASFFVNGKRFVSRAGIYFRSSR
jgi:hypothetical protein